MSVRVNQRKQNTLGVLSSAKELTAHTVKICSNEKHIPKRYRWTLAQPIIQEALAVQICIARANKEPLDDTFYGRRREFQVDAAGHLAALSSLADTAYNLFHFESMEYWESLIDAVDIQLAAWAKSDKERMKKGQ